MASIIEISCPKCERPMKAPANGIGKKIRCKGCEHSFIIKEPPSKKKTTAGNEISKQKATSKKAVSTAKSSKTRTPKPTDDDEDDAAGYDMTHVEFAPRCPSCANELESEEDIICLHCGYNLQTRTKFDTKVLHEQTGGDKFLWLLPGILCCIAIVVMIGYAFFHYYGLPGAIDDELGGWIDAADDGRGRLALFAFDGEYAEELKAEIEFWHYIFHPGIALWIFVAALYGSWKAGVFAYKRLVLHPKPPEIEKEHRKKKSPA